MGVRPSSQIPDLISAINHFNKREQERILLIDADKSRHKEWIRRLRRVGITCDTQADSVGSTSAIQAILRFLSIPNGQDAWSTAKLFDIAQSKAFPIIGNLFSDLPHPEKKDWRPRPHLDVIENIGRSFHVLGGKGALQRWLGSLSVAKPYAVEAYRREEELRAIEETQWWLQCLATSWIALLDETEKSFLAHPFVGASSNVSLPLPEPSKTPRDVLSTILHACDWEALFERTRHYDASVGAVQTWVRSIDGLLRYQSSLPFIDLCRLAPNKPNYP